MYQKTKGIAKKPPKQFMITGIRKLLTEPTSRRLLVDSTMQFINDCGKFEDIIEKNLNSINNNPLPNQFIDGLLSITQEDTTI